MAEGERVTREALPASTLVLDFLKSSVGAKVLMAATGAALWAFVIVHLLGNLQIFQGADALNAYGPWLRSLGHGTAIWVARGGLALAFVVHIFYGARLSMLNRKARPVGYRKQKSRATSGAAKLMLPTGILILAFVVFHLAHTTWGLVLPDWFADANMTALKEGGASVNVPDVFGMMSKAFHLWWVVLVYIIGQTILLAHLFHGTASLWQSIGWHHPTWSPVVGLVSRSLGAVIVIGNVSMPLFIFFSPAT